MNRSYSRSPSPDIDRSSRGYDRQQNFRSRYRSYSRERYEYDYPSEDDGCRVHIGDISPDLTEKELERVFEKYGKIKEVWMAKSPPCFAFINYKHPDDAEEAVRDMDGRTVAGNRIRVSIAKPRRRGQGGYNPNMRCYTCGTRGHFSRDCDQLHSNSGGGGGGSRMRREYRDDYYSYRYSPSRSSVGYGYSRSPRRY